MKSPETDPNFKPPVGNLNAESQADDARFRAKVQEALDDPRPALPHDEVSKHFAKRRAAALGLAAEQSEADPQGRVKLGSLLEAMGREAGLSDEEFAAFDEMRASRPQSRPTHARPSEDPQD